MFLWDERLDVLVLFYILDWNIVYNASIDLL